MLSMSFSRFRNSDNCIDAYKNTNKAKSMKKKKMLAHQFTNNLCNTPTLITIHMSDLIVLIQSKKLY